MLEKMQSHGRAVRWGLAVVIGFIALSMLITMLPGTLSSPSASPDIVVEVGGQAITATEVRRRIQLMAGGRSIPAAIEPFYAKQVLDELIMNGLMEVEAERQGLRVTRQEQADRIRVLVPAAKAGDMQQYASEVLQRFQMSVPEFEDAVRKSMVTEKFAQVITDGISVSPEEVGEEFRRRNEKITIEYALVKPDELESRVSVSDAELAAHYEKNKASYQVPEKRTIRYAMLDSAQARSGASVTDAELRAYYNENIAQYRSENRSKVSHILFKTDGKTDAEVEEIRKKAEDVLKQARGKAKFEDLAKQHSEDATKDKGGEVGWIIAGQALPEYEKTAFSLAKGSISDVVKTQIGFYIIKVQDRETARTQPFEEVRAQILPVLTAQKGDRAASDLADKLGSTIRQNTRTTIDDLAKQFEQFSMAIGEAGPSAVREPYGALGASAALDDSVYRLREGELSAPIQVPQGYVVLSLKKVDAAHQGTLAEARSRVEADVRREKSITLARSHAEDVAAKAKSGSLAAAAKAAGVNTKTSEAFARTGSIPDVGSARQVAAAFSMNTGDVSSATSLGSNWVIYRIASKEPVNALLLVQQMKEVEQSLLQSKRQLAFEAFTAALRKRLTDEGHVKYNQENMARLTNPRT